MGGLRKGVMQRYGGCTHSHKYRRLVSTHTGEGRKKNQSRSQTVSGRETRRGDLRGSREICPGQRPLSSDPAPTPLLGHQSAVAWAPRDLRRWHNWTLLHSGSPWVSCSQMHRTGHHREGDSGAASRAGLRWKKGEEGRRAERAGLARSGAGDGRAAGARVGGQGNERWHLRSTQWVTTGM